MTNDKLTMTNDKLNLYYQCDCDVWSYNGYSMECVDCGRPIDKETIKEAINAA